MDGSTVILFMELIAACLLLSGVLGVIGGLTERRGFKKFFKAIVHFLIRVVWLAPVAYLSWGAIYWLRHGTWVIINLCHDAGVFCETGQMLGADRISRALADSPFAVLVVFTGVVYFALFYLDSDIGEMERLDEEVRRLKADKEG